MKISFSDYDSNESGGWLFHRGNTEYWSRVLRLLKADSGLTLFSKAFEKWLLDTWEITVLYENRIYPNMISGVELSDETLTMILIKYPTT